MTSEDSPSSSTVHKQQAKLVIKTKGDIINSVAFFADGKRIVGGSTEGKIRCWRVEDGGSMGIMDAGSEVMDIAVSRDGKWVVSGTKNGLVIVWNATSYKKVTAFAGHGSSSVRAVDVSPDGTRIATGSNDKTACVWSLSAGQRLLGPLQENGAVVMVKFSPNGRLIVTAITWNQHVRVYDSQRSRHLEIQASKSINRFLTWTSDSKQLFGLSDDGNIVCLDLSTRTTLVKWPIHASCSRWSGCIALASNGTFIAASAYPSVSLWDTTTHEHIGSIVMDTDDQIKSIAISTNNVLAMGGSDTITLRSLLDVVPSSYSDPQRMGLEQADPEEVIKSPSSLEKIARLEETVQQLRDQLFDSQHRADGLNELLHAQEMNSNTKIAHLEKTIQQLRTQHAHSQHTADSLLQILHAYEQKDQCEALYAEGRIIDAAASFLEIFNTVSEDVRANRHIMDWLAKFKSQCISTLEMLGDKASNTEQQDEAAAAYSAALSLGLSTPDTFLTKWAHIMLTRSSVSEVSSAAAKFKLPSFVIRRTICDILEGEDRLLEAIKCFLQFQSELEEDTGNHDEQAQSGLCEAFRRRRSDVTDSFHTTMNILEKQTMSMDETEWVANFKMRSLKTLEQRGDVAVDSALYKDAVVYYTIALALDPLSTDLLTKRSRARAAIGSWQDSLEDADAAIKLDPSCPRGYERKHAALLGAHRYDEAIKAYNDMLLKLEQSPDPFTRELRNHYVSPSQTMAAIRSSVKRIQRDIPLVLINTETGCLCDEHERLDEFEGDPKFKELVASTTTRLDKSRITQIVRQYFEYATFSHTWEGAEPLFHDVLPKPLHKLAASPTVLKLMMFCATVREAGLRWAWSDTCCINKTDSSVLQESLTSMFQWYHAAALTIVHLKGVRSDSELGALERSFWNTRVWTLQEFFASRVVRFYTEDWKPYLPQESAYNHKDSSVIMGEMAAANGVDVQVLLSLRPGSENVRQKLCLAARRISAKPEDIAYSLFGIFDVSIPVTYGEGQQRALGRLLEEVLTRSGDVMILAWTGKASDHNSCLPSEIGVYREPASSYIPSLIEDDKTDALVTELRTSLYLNSAVMLYDRVIALPSSRLVSRRLSLSCIMFPLRGLSVASGDSQHIYRAVTSALGSVEIKTMEDLSSLKNLVLVHPWLQCLLDPGLPFEDLIMNNDAELLTPVDGDGGDSDSDVLSSFSPPGASPSYDKLTRALRLFARLRQPFGALLLVPLSHNEYKRIAPDHHIVVQLLENVSPHYLTQKIRTLDIL